MLLTKMAHFTNNTAASKYGIIGCDYYCLVTVKNSDFNHNKGRGIFIYNSSGILITTCMFRGNTVATSGAAVAMRWDGEYQKTVMLTATQMLRSFAHQNTDVGLMEMLQTADQEKFKHNEPGWEINNCTFMENVSGIGGAIAAANITLKLTQSQFVNNHANGTPVSGHGYGGAVWLQESAAYVIGCNFSGNRASFGGGIAAQGEFLLINSSKFINNEATDTEISTGGAINIHLPTQKHFLVMDSVFCENKAYYAGGAIGDYTDGFFTIQESMFQKNSAASGGAIKFSSANITACDFDANIAHWDGGALFSPGNSHIEISFCNFTNNGAYRGGGIYVSENASILCNVCAFHNNTAVFR